MKEPSVCVRRRGTPFVLLALGDVRDISLSAGPLIGTIRGMRLVTLIALCGLSLWMTHQGSLYISPTTTSDRRNNPGLGTRRQTVIIPLFIFIQSDKSEYHIYYLLNVFKRCVVAEIFLPPLLLQHVLFAIWTCLPLRQRMT